jgi:hypothetical protein
MIFHLDRFFSGIGSIRFPECELLFWRDPFPDLCQRHLEVHHVITPKQKVANGQNVMEGAGEQEQQDHSSKCDDDGFMIFLY